MCLVHRYNSRSQMWSWLYTIDNGICRWEFGCCYNFDCCRWVNHLSQQALLNSWQGTLPGLKWTQTSLQNWVNEIQILLNTFLLLILACANLWTVLSSSNMIVALCWEHTLFIPFTVFQKIQQYPWNTRNYFHFTSFQNLWDKNEHYLNCPQIVSGSSYAQHC